MISLSTVANTQGVVVEVGSHEDLLNKGGKYAELWARQRAKGEETTL